MSPIACVRLCVCACDSGEQLSTGRRSQRGAISHGGLTHIKDTHKHGSLLLQPMCHDNHKARILKRLVRHGHCHMVLTAEHR